MSVLQNCVLNSTSLDALGGASTGTEGYLLDADNLILTDSNDEILEVILE